MIIQNVCRPCGAPVVTTASKCAYCQTEYPHSKSSINEDQLQQYFAAARRAQYSGYLGSFNTQYQGQLSSAYCGFGVGNIFGRLF